MARRDKLPPKVGYPAMVLFAGFVVSIVVAVALGGRSSDFNPWVVGFGGALLLLITASYTVLNALDRPRSVTGWYGARSTSSASQCAGRVHGGGAAGLGGNAEVVPAPGVAGASQPTRSSHQGCTQRA